MVTKCYLLLISCTRDYFSYISLVHIQVKEEQAGVENNILRVSLFNNKKLYILLI